MTSVGCKIKLTDFNSSVKAPQDKPDPFKNQSKICVIFFTLTGILYHTVQSTSLHAFKAFMLI